MRVCGVRGRAVGGVTYCHPALRHVVLQPFKFLFFTSILDFWQNREADIESENGEASQDVDEQDNNRDDVERSVGAEIVPTVFIAEAAPRRSTNIRTTVSQEDSRHIPNQCFYGISADSCWERKTVGNGTFCLLQVNINHDHSG